MARKSTIARMTDEIRSYIEARLAEGRCTLDELIADLRARWPAEAESGELPSRSAVHRYGQKLERRLEAIKASTEAARLIRSYAGDAEDARSEALIAMIQSELFESIVNLQEAAAEDMDPAERVGLLSTAAKHIATLTRSSVYLKKFQAEIEEAERKRVVAEADAKLQATARAQGMDEAQVEFWRKQVLGIG